MPPISNATQRSLITMIPGVELERVASPRYRWDSAARGHSPFVIFQWTRSGIGIYETPGLRREVPPGHAFITILPEAAQYYYPSDATAPWSFAWVNFYGELAISLWQAFRDQHGPVVRMDPDSESAARLLELIRSRQDRQAKDRFAASTRAYGFYVSLLRELSEPATRDVVQASIDFIESNPLGRVTVKELAAATGLSREHFTRIFAKTLGCSPADWLRNRRLDQAAGLLSSTALPIAEVALRCGFCSVRHLRHAFRNRFGKLPSETRPAA